eukprot:10916284-Prorocentrum_lima.AAC.1
MSAILVQDMQRSASLMSGYGPLLRLLNSSVEAAVLGLVEHAGSMKNLDMQACRGAADKLAELRRTAFSIPNAT